MILGIATGGESCAHELTSWGRAVPDPGPMGRVGKPNPCKSMGQTVSFFLPWLILLKSKKETEFSSY